MWAIIGGSGFEKFEAFKTIKKLDVKTPFGKTSSGIKKVKIGEHECLFLSRHGEHHELTPSGVNYRANIYALKKYGAKAIMAFSAVGSLQKELKPGDLVVPTQYIDRTKGVRKHTFCGDGIVGHVSLAKPTCYHMTERLMGLAKGFKFESHFNKTYVVIEGPYFSTKAESLSYRQMNGDIIGMTNFPEFALAREAGLSYLPCCFVTDYDCWDDATPHVTLNEVLEVMRNNNSKAFEVAQAVLQLGSGFLSGCDCAKQGLKAGLMTAKERIPKKHQAWLKVLLG
jgi:5'-methylthioadenosine phosphorylase